MPSPDSTNSSPRRKFDSLEQEVYLSLWRTYDRLKAIEEQLFAPIGISPQQYNALRLLKSVSPHGLTVQGIGDRLISRAPDMTRLLDRLEERGWVARVRRTENRRVVDVSITPNGLALLEDLAARVRECHQEQLGHLSSEQLTVLLEGLSAARAPHEERQGAWARESQANPLSQ